jgi:hypothetical protein
VKKKVIYIEEFCPNEKVESSKNLTEKMASPSLRPLNLHPKFEINMKVNWLHIKKGEEHKKTFFFL